MAKKQEEEWDRSTCTFCHPKPTKPLEKMDSGRVSAPTSNSVIRSMPRFIRVLPGYKNTALLLTDLYNRSKIDGTVVARENNYVIFECLLKDKERFGNVVNFQRMGEEGDPNRPYSFVYSAAHSQEYDKLRRGIRPVKAGHATYSSFGNTFQQKFSVSDYKGPREQVRGYRTIQGPLISYEEDIVQPVTEKEHHEKPATIPVVKRGTNSFSRGRHAATAMPTVQQRIRKPSRRELC